VRIQRGGDCRSIGFFGEVITGGLQHGDLYLQQCDIILSGFAGPLTFSDLDRLPVYEFIGLSRQIAERMKRAAKQEQEYKRNIASMNKGIR